MRSLFLLLAGLYAGSAAAGVAVISADAGAAPEPAAAKADSAKPAPDAAAARDAFLAQLRAHCGKAYAGRIVADTPPSADNPFAGKPLVMHLRDCTADTLRIPFHVGDDRSRTWIITRLDGGRLRLKHDHRHEDGSSDAMTPYGGETQAADRDAAADRWRYEFPADAESKALFQKLDRAVSIPNVWALELDGQRFIYELARPGRLFRVEFDLGKPQKLPPAAWGAESRK
ncbi:hypothetical protein [Tahibacter harae]|uniref:Secreted protein n=1 Tax=Tahibacter harae TaxID=2963937 RepID=A0ABT1QQT5_9GAMM|nr:hypothetical protein [Tahibacter harae]MCQ4164636.1 hypothetical protein [Tahibacter harae]